MATEPKFRVSFQLKFRSPDMNAIDLPISIRKPNAALVERTRSSRPVELAPGTYYVSARLPAGQHITRSFEVKDRPEVLVLEPDPEDEPQNEWDEARHFLDPTRPAGPAATPVGSPHVVASTGSADAPPMGSGPYVVEAFGAREAAVTVTRGAPSPPRAAGVVAGGLRPGEAYVRVFSGNLFQGTGSFHHPETILGAQQHEPGQVVYFLIQAADPVVVQLLEVGAPALNMVVPQGARLAVSRRPDGAMEAGSRFKMEAFTASAPANLLLRYSRQGAFRRAGDAVESERLLAAKIEDPVAGAIGAYCLLRVGDLERLHDWTANLHALFPWLPDGAAIRGEHLARLGRHAEALAAFADLPARGLPLLADGLFYAVERLKVYSRLKAEASKGVDVANAARLLTPLNRFAGAVHRQRPLTSYPGLDPAHPDMAVLSADNVLPGAMPLPWLDPPLANAAPMAPNARSTAPNASGTAPDARSTAPNASGTAPRARST